MRAIHTRLLSCTRPKRPLLVVILATWLASASAASASAGEPTNAAEAAATKAAEDKAINAGFAKWKAGLSAEQQAWETVLEQNLGNYYLPGYKRQKLAGTPNAFDYVLDDPKLPRVLLIGDSISGGYTRGTQAGLAGRANVHRAPENCGPTANGLKKLEVWLGSGKWDVIHFNFGIHDRATPLADYAQRLEQIVTRLKRTRARLIWATSTPIPRSETQKLNPAAIVERNAAAARIMAANDIPVDDLFAWISPEVARLQRPDDVHFTPDGYARLAEAVARSIAACLPKPAPTDPSRNAAADQHAVLGIPVSRSTYQRTTHPDAQWFPEAGLGLFIHWGISSVHGGIDLSWGMMYDKPWDAQNKAVITPTDYFALAKSFRPDRFNPDEWLKAAKAAGFRYAVMTTRHHDGFALWPSAHGEFGVKQFLPGVDLVKGFVEACRRNGLKCGLYYSPPDWYFHRAYMSFHYGSGNEKRFPGRKHFGLNHEIIDAVPAPPAEFEERYRGYVRGQITELLTLYGKIDIMWFDGGPEVIAINEIRGLQPGILVNPRMHGYGDFETPETRFPEKPIEGWWEMCDIWHRASWGYQTSAEVYKPASWMLGNLVRVRSWGGNFLPNVGPRPTGEMPDAYYREMAKIGEWMKVNSESVFGVRRGPPAGKANVPVIDRPGISYLFLLPQFNETVVIDAVGKPAVVETLDGHVALPFSVESGRLNIDVPRTVRTGSVDVVRVTWRR